jgi:AraC-like DNA-binding protein
MSEEARYTRFVAARARPAPLTSGDTFHWDGRGAVSRRVEPTLLSEPGGHGACLAPPPAPGHRVTPAAPTRPLDLLPAPLVTAIDWANEAAHLTVSLAPALLLAPLPPRLPRVTGTLIWLYGQGERLTRATHPSLLVQTADASLQGEYAELVLHLPITDPLSDHIALVLQAAVDAEGEAGQLYAEALAEALAVHFLRRYTAAQPARCEVSGGLAPYKLRRVLAYIQTHLEEKLSLEQLATVAQLSPAHFARLFKHATGWAPHQYASRCRIEHAKRLLTETDMSLIDISAGVGCTDPSHFAALFRRYVAMAPNAYRRTMGGPLPHSCTTLFLPGEREALLACSSKSK